MGGLFSSETPINISSPIGSQPGIQIGSSGFSSGSQSGVQITQEDIDTVKNEINRKVQEIEMYFQCLVYLTCGQIAILPVERRNSTVITPVHTVFVVPHDFFSCTWIAH